MQKLLLFTAFVALVIGCKDQGKSQEVAEGKTVFFSFQDMPEAQTINSKAGGILADWQEFQDFESSFQVLYRAKNNEDLALAIDDLLNKEKAMVEGEYPETFDNAQIKSRQRVVRTFLLKVKASIIEQTDVNEPMAKMLLANNALRAQFNVMVNSKLDINLILDEK